ncbi:hypothetical protein DICSQDRAFT_137518 [Dichomitus squalens LYAD-421 SS1]|uniref:Uncharacterized protein n=1 Tax=Dichomitus squalens (strain LYAD-421) TaxID=732165 RepID=R7SWU0_DICSQ|nr:uncharacterized protein DICSQDRAFT_137518 [Dichomitus squalens LYAD-421 SS1]EJF60433.1 hypothetical protein DICSQDRAFT_137518 [Dichomitus squalens LYAD-421 SS1]
MSNPYPALLLPGGTEAPSVPVKQYTCFPRSITPPTAPPPIPLPLPRSSHPRSGRSFSIASPTLLTPTSLPP